MKNRFWEYYLVRYIAPTGLAMILVAYLFFVYANEILYLAGITKEQFIGIFGKQMNAINLIIWSGLGFLYMYIASMGLLLLHTIRFCFTECISFYECYKKLSKNRTDFVENSDNNNSIFLDVKWKKDIQESYRHMREHGNSFGIMLFEIVLTCLLIKTEFQVINILILLLIWFFIGFVSWIIATKIEFNFLKEENSYE